MNISNEQLLAKLASQLDDEGLVALDLALQKVAAAAVQDSQQQVNDFNKLAEDLASNYSLGEIEGALSKLAEERQSYEECEKIAADCAAMGTMVGDYATERFISNLESYVKVAMEEGEEEEEEEEEEEGKKSKSKETEEAGEEEEEEEEKSAARIDLLRRILAGVSA